jgi:cephalosporin-C deacetylase-like acetyl esterase
MSEEFPEFKHYPDETAIDVWVDGIWQEGQKVEFEAELLTEHELGPTINVRHLKGHHYVRFSPQSMDPFYGYWQPAPSHPAPLLVHTPGYGAEMSIHPDLVMQGYNVLHVNPLGYVTPAGADEAKKRDDNWPVFSDTLTSGAQEGYHQWLINCALAIKWAQSREEVIPDRVSFFGTSQGGGASLLLGSIYQGRGVRCVAADEPFMVNFPQAKVVHPDWWSEYFDGITPEVWRALGFIDTVSHARRLTVPVMLTAGEKDTACPPPTIESLFERLPATRMYCYLHGQEHDYTQQFIALTTAWFRLYA